MLEDLFQIHQEVMSKIPMGMKRYLYSQINWKAAGLCIVGDRGVGKTTMLCQDLLERYKNPNNALYLSADHVNVISYGLVSIAKSFFSLGGKALYIDEVHKYPEWSTEIKNLLDTYKGRQIIFSASSSLDLYHARLSFGNLDSARQSQIDSNEKHHSPMGKGDEEDRFGKAAASPNSHNLAGRGIYKMEKLL